ncbi:MAG: glycerol-3-phosphate 1-O-acyltransferase PlsY [Pseudomonadota bacterium]
MDLLPDAPPLTLALAAALGYLLGSIPFGLIISALAGEGDIRKIGSGNIGATNALRTGKKWIAAMTLIGDISKGVAAVFLARAFLHPELGTIAGVAAFFGHLYPVWIGFKGGKGVATFLGILVALYWPIGLAAIAVWILTLLLFRFSSLASLNAALMAPVISIGIGQTALALAVGVLSVLIFIKHKDNIGRLSRGEEPKVGRKPKAE